MAGYKKIKAKDVKSLDFGTWELKDLIDQSDSKKLSAAIITHKGNKPELHHSDLSDRIYYAISGKGEFHFKDEVIKVEEGDLIFLPKGTVYCSVGDNDFACLSISSPSFDQEYEIND